MSLCFCHVVYGGKWDPACGAKTSIECFVLRMLALEREWLRCVVCGECVVPCIEYGALRKVLQFSMPLEGVRHLA